MRCGAETRLAAAKSKLAAAEADLDVLKAGSWKPSLRSGGGGGAGVQAAVKQTEAEIERRTIKCAAWMGQCCR